MDEGDIYSPWTYENKLYAVSKAQKGSAPYFSKLVFILHVKL